MPYVTQIQIQNKIPAPFLNDALDDDKDGQPDKDPATGITLLASIIQMASDEVDGFLAGTYSVPFADPAPVQVRNAALALAVEGLYKRRGIVPKEVTDPADAWRKRLEKIANREINLDANTPIDLEASYGSQPPIAMRVPQS